jgi:hypothetical protein
MRRGYPLRTVWALVVAGAAILAAPGCGGRSLGGANPPPTGIGGRGGGSGGQGSAASGGGGAGGGAGGGGDAGGTAGVPSGEGGGVSGAGGTFVGTATRKVDLLFMIDNSPEMTEMQLKLHDQVPGFLSLLSALPGPPDLHVAVVSSDLGAPGDSLANIGCTTQGDQGLFQSYPRGTCTDTTLENGSAFISDDGAGNVNYTDPNGIGAVLQCIMLLGDKGCGFEHQLASIDRALGADGVVNGANAGFLRPDALLAIIILSNEDDCSAPADTKLYSLNGGMQNITNPLGPVANYRCNEYGHLCTDPGTGAVISPPLVFPDDAQGTPAAPTLDLANCTSNDSSGLLTPVAKFILDIWNLKSDPKNQIIVGAIIAPTAPYTVKWVKAVGGQNSPPGELWPQMEHSCGPAGSVNPESINVSTDGSFGDPGVRIAQFARAFPKSHLGSICDASYAPVLAGVAADITQAISP